MSFRLRGRVAAVCGRRIRLRIPAAIVGDSALVGGEGAHVLGAIERVERDGATLSAHGDATGIACGDFATIERPAPRASLGLAALGRTLDARGRAGDGGPPVDGLPLRAKGASMERVAVSEPLWTGIRAIDGLLSIGRGARFGIYGAPGAGKSTLLSLIAKAVSADAVVMALVGERHREATEWRARVDARTSLVVATCDRPPDERVAAAKLALAQARSLCERGLDVVVLLDSLARFASALRDVAVAAEEPIGRGGYPPSVFAGLARLLESAGPCRSGSVSLIATVLSEGPDELDPVCTGTRALLDGHLVLSSAIAAAGRFPAIDLLASSSRTMQHVASREHASAARIVRRRCAAITSTAELRGLGIADNDPYATADEARLEAFLRQEGEANDPERTLEELHRLADILGERSWTSPAT